MSEYFADSTVTIHDGDCLDVLRQIPDASIDSVVTDPPYALNFMGKEWDRFAGYVERNGSARYLGDDGGRHDEGYRNMRGREHEFQGWCEAWARECLRALKPGGHLLAFGGARTFHRLACGVEDAGFEIRDALAWLYGSGFPKNANVLKPGFELITLGRKPLIGSVALNVGTYGTGGLNIGACRIGDMERENPAFGVAGWRAQEGRTDIQETEARTAVGRWPANVVLDESQAAVLDEQSGESQARVGRPRGAGSGDGWGMTATRSEYSDLGGASRFYYVAKPDTAERVRINGVAHPTVKPLDLMRWLIRLATPEGGTVLDPFAGSGTTVEGCILEGFRCIAIEREPEYLPLIKQRVHRRRDPVAAIKAASGDDGGLFDLLGEVSA